MFTSLHWTTLNERRYVLIRFERSVSGVCDTSHKRVLGLNERIQQFTSTFSALKIEPKSDKVPQDETAKRHIQAVTQVSGPNEATRSEIRTAFCYTTMILTKAN